MRYKSCINTFQKLMCAVVCLLIIIALIMNPFMSGIASLIIGSVLLFILLHEYYEIKAQYLMIKKGLEKSRINILDIELLNMVKVREIIYVEILSQNNKISVKPVETEVFIQHLIKINPNIKVQNMMQEMKNPINTLINEPFQ
ncbi:hypothetical protein [Macrococcus animalis]|uniref:hypothetical protein n=1 Tax=Macrococcus animalis TaxID=3395467 RepID=UPI0039BF4D9D